MLAWLEWYPPVGVFIGVLGLLGVLVPLLRDLSKIGRVEKATWTAIVFILAGLEIRSIYLDRDAHDREQAAARAEQLLQFSRIAKGLDVSIATSQKHFTATLTAERNNLARTLGGLKETVNAATGGDGFCYAILIPPGYAGNAAVFSTVIPQGKYPLTNVNLLVTDDDMIVRSLDKVSKGGTLDTGEEFANTMQRAQEWLHIGDLPPHFSEQFSLGRAATVTGDKRMLTINFWANNGSWTEKFALRRVNGKWLKLIRVWREKLDKKKNAFVADVIFDQVDDGFPEDTNTKDPHGVSASPSH